METAESNSVVTILNNIGYDNLIEDGRFVRAKPLYRESDNNTSLRIDKVTGKWIDFSARESGGLELLVKKTLNVSDDKVKEVLGGLNLAVVGKYTPPAITVPEYFSKEKLQRLEKNHEYWIKRGISLETISQFQGGVAHSGKMNGRYVFPIFDLKDRIVGFAGRDLWNTYEDRPKWKLISKKTEWIYPAFLNVSEILIKKEVIITESIGDLLSLYDSGVRNVLVAFGVKISSSLVSFLLKMDPKKIYISFNNDIESEVGQKACLEAKKTLTRLFDESQIKIALPNKKDFGEQTKEENLSWYKNLPNL